MGEPQSIRAVIVEDHHFFRHGLKELLREEGVQVVGEAANGEDGVRVALHTRPDVIVMDLHMPGIDGVEATRRIRAKMPDARVVVLTISTESDEVREAIVAGASGYLLKGSPLGDIVAGIKATAAGGSQVSSEVAGPLLERLRGREGEAAVAAGVDLSERETDVLRLVAAGLDNAQIAERLHIAPATVKHHVSSILDKLGVENRSQAAVYAVRSGLV
jgi:NarL family two-component system response regulator LiaR